MVPTDDGGQILAIYRDFVEVISKAKAEALHRIGQLTIQSTWSLTAICHMERSMSWYFLTMDDMSPDGLWDCDEESMKDGHYGG
jgi:hypothetical protein